jgi:uncharacterized protein (TIGR00251 family)
MTTRLKVRVTPNARSDQLVGLSTEEVRVKIQAPAQDGKANTALVRFLCELLDCRKSQIQIILGEKSRIKTVEIAGIDAPEVWRRLELQRGTRQKGQIM